MLNLCFTGAHGIDFSSFKKEAFQNTQEITDGVCRVAKHLLEHGVTAFCPTIVTSTPEYYKRVSSELNSLIELTLFLCIRSYQLSHRQEEGRMVLLC